ncbi:hypothetical protein PPROV_000507700 [Pycnococcus provasolii]|uniref:Transcription elongation factor 1 homolog n=1 Tax=Pycnococcus provasolii TaxID=41880 RepID=A0A830HKJ2_9CHLO|nr:hypothetical protein PPROV_000507700 [Pycnococcus provasolii]|mmetsp:Transcript_2911/g.6486  ORF Transcript_2911/g.6486 Transcript_2911/m.6486 type:complete len:83 (-) Transcript_2911:166-414(-)
MGKRKTSKAPPKKPRPKLSTTFNCPFCNHEKSVVAKMDLEKGLGIVECGRCGKSHVGRITPLSDPIDLYSEWIDACEEVNAA